MKIVGEAEIEDVIIEKPETVWEKTQTYSGIDKNFFDRYYEGKSQAIAYKLRCVKKYKFPKKLVDYGLKSAPQSFVYINK